MDGTCDRLFVANLPHHIDERRLEKIFEEYGFVKEVIIASDKSGVSKGFGFVTMGSARAAQIAVQAAAGMNVDGRTINVVFSHKTTMERSEVCTKYKKGECSRGDSCRYIHEGPIDLPLKTGERTNDRSNEACRDFKIGKCIHGSNCRFIHEYDNSNISINNNNNNNNNNNRREDREADEFRRGGGGAAVDIPSRDPPNGRYSRSVSRNNSNRVVERSRSRE